MLTAEGCRARRERLWNATQGKADLILLAEPWHLTYFAGFSPTPFSFRHQNAQALLVLDLDGRTLLIADNMLAAAAEAAHVDEVVSPIWYQGRASAPPRTTLLLAAALDRLGSIPGTRIGVDGLVSAELLAGLRKTGRGVELLRLGSVIHRLRRRKLPDEVDALRTAIAAAEAGFRTVQRELHAGMTELDAYALFHHAALQHLGRPSVIYGDFASGERTCQGGGPATARTLNPGDPFLLDASVVVDGYRGDFANTWIVDGSPTPEMVRYAELCLEAMAAGEALLLPGTPCRDVWAAVQAVFDRAGVGDRFGHHAGHGLGLGHPDAPYLVPESTETLEAGDVVTLEPGLYFPWLVGMRFERNYLITENGPENLTHHSLGIESASPGFKPSTSPLAEPLSAEAAAAATILEDVPRENTPAVEDSPAQAPGEDTAPQQTALPVEVPDQSVDPAPTATTSPADSADSAGPTTAVEAAAPTATTFNEAAERWNLRGETAPAPREAGLAADGPSPEPEETPLAEAETPPPPEAPPSEPRA